MNGTKPNGGELRTDPTLTPSPSVPASQPSTPRVPVGGLVSSQPPPIPDHDLIRPIGHGAYGEVWLARHTRLGTLRAVKLIRRDQFGDARPFQREFSGIQHYEPISRGHPNLVSILHVGGSDDGFFYVMELADGEEMQNEKCKMKNEGAANPTASDRQQSILNFEFSILNYRPKTLRSELKQHGALPIDRVLEIGHALAAALAHLHGHKLVHRDVKPSNVIFVGGVPKLADIGLVTGLDEARSLVGTEGYTPLDGLGTPAADCYALGKLLYELSTGHDRTDWPEPPANLATRPDRKRLLELNAILHRACAPDPRERYESAEEMHDELALLQTGRSVQQKRRMERRFAMAKKLSLAAAALVLVVTAAWLLSGNLSWRPPATLNAAASATADPMAGRLIAIKPFINTSGKPEDESLKGDLDGQFREAFADITGSKLVLTNSRAIKNPAEDVREIGRRLNVRAVLEGSVSRVGNHGLAMVRLLRTSDGRELYEGSHEFEIHNGGGGLRPLIKSVTDALLADLSIVGSDRLAARCQRRWEVVNNLIEGHYVSNTGTKDGFTRAIEHYNRAIALDPNCAQAYSDLAWAWREAAGWHMPPRMALSESRKYALRALEIDDTSVSAHISLAYAKWFCDWDWAGAAAEFQRAVALAPNSGGAHSRYAGFLAAQGRSAEALDEHTKAFKLWPNAYDVVCLFAAQLRLERDYDRAIELCQGVLWADSNNIVALTVLARTYESRGEVDKAIALFSRARKLDDAPDLIGPLGHCLAAKGEPDKAKALLDKLTELSFQRHVSGTFKAQIHIGLGERNEAIACLQAACEEHAPNVTTLKIDPYWEPLRADPRFQALLKKVGLEK